MTDENTALKDWSLKFYKEVHWQLMLTKACVS
jgi:hypothetical protein